MYVGRPGQPNLELIDLLARADVHPANIQWCSMTTTLRVNTRCTGARRRIW